MATLHALLIAINRYHPQSGVSSLRGCENDINSFHRFLKKEYADRSLSIKILKNEIATRQNIVETFQKHLIQKAKAGDTVLIYYCGHGSYARTALEFEAYDPKKQDETLVCYDSRLPGHYDLTDKEIAVLLSQIPEDTHTVFIADSCHSASVTRSTKNEFNLGKRRFTAARDSEESRQLTSYLLDKDNYYAKMWQTQQKVEIPHSKHILLSACDREEEAWETQDGRGLFSSVLLSQLEQNKSVTYSQLFAKVRQLITKSADNQLPTISPLEGFNPNTIFLQPKEVVSQKKHLVQYINGAWRMAYGAIHGLPTSKEAVEQLKIGLFEEDQLEHTISAKAVLLKETILDFEEADTNKTFMAGILTLPNPLLVNLTGEADALAKFASIYSTSPSAFVQFLEDTAEGKYTLNVSDTQLLIHNTDTQQLIHGREGLDTDGVTYIVDILERIEEWERLATLENKATRFAKNAVEVVFYDATDEHNLKPYKGHEITFDYPKVGEDKDSDGDFVMNYYEIKASNTSDKKLYVALLHLSPDYGVSTFFKCTEIPAHSDELVLDNQHGLGIFNQDLHEVTDVFKVLISTAPFDDYPFQQDAFKLGFIAPKTKAIATRSVRKRKRAEDDWYTQTIKVNTIRKSQTIDGNTIAFDKEGLTIKAPEGFKAAIAFAPVKNPSRSVHTAAMLSTIFQDEAASLMNLSTETTRSVQDKTIIELSGIEKEEALKDNPLEITIQQELRRNEQLIPVTFDGEFVIPFGEVVKTNKGVQIKINEIPHSQIDQRRRSIKKAAWFCLLKMTGFKDYAFRLRHVRYNTKGEPIRTSSGINVKVAQSEKILLVLHGIIGDTKPMLKNLEFLIEEGHYDLILTYDYENLNEPIEQIAEKLKELLAKVELKPNHSKQLDILAHSMGGLVSRHLLENLYKDQVLVRRLMMFGTPNGGSPFGKLPEYRDLLVKLLTVALNLGKVWLGPVSVYLGMINKGLAATIPFTKTLSQMSADSNFTKNLAKNNQASAQYYIVSGDITDYHTSADKRLARLMENVLLKVGNLANMNIPNDIAVSVEQIEGLPAGFGVEKTQLICHHLNYFEEGASLDRLRKIVEG